MRTKSYAIAIALFLISLTYSWSQVNPIQHFDFDKIRVERQKANLERGETYVPKEVFAYVTEASGKEHNLNGKYYKSVPGVKGNAVLLDGYTAYVNIEEEFDEEADAAIRDELTEFTVESWVALGAYPKNFCSIFNHRRPLSDGSTEGYSLELDSWGRPVLKLGTYEGKMETVMSDKQLELNAWTHVAGTYSPAGGMTLYINGEQVANRKFEGTFSTINYHGDVEKLIGRSRVAARPTGTIRPEGTEKSLTYLDGILDELKLYDKSLDAKTIATAYKKESKSLSAPALPKRKFPSGPQSPGVFRAVNTTLEYYPGWDAPWAVDKHADVVVQFDETDCKFVFWRGTGYIPSWVSENGIFFNNGFNEGWNDHGSCEPMSDKKTKYSSVKIIESTPARVVVQWRYGLVDVVGNFAFEDPQTGWGDWTNETYTIYPDMSAVREDVLLSNAPNAAHEWQESMVVMEPGQRPESVLEFEALTVSNIGGDSKTYSWEHQAPPLWPPYPQNITNQIVNTKSKYKPFSSLRPQDIAGGINGGQPASMDVYAGELRRNISVFPWWNHWPVATRPTDGRFAMVADRGSHASLSHYFWNAYKTTDRSMTKIMLCGMTDQNIETVVKQNKSWSNPAAISLGDNASKAYYKPEEKAYTIALDDQVPSLAITLDASKESPVLNPAFVVENWGQRNLSSIEVNGEALNAKDGRYGFKNSLNSVDLIVWVKAESDAPITIDIAAQN
ncbi:LamG domain-containing protein [Flagellimonas algicola]|uniref:LamG domain-containing protein n=1 Tax=Flagellimonas algicola TaxID=2583815 RepID=A0ABY2WJ76_9FLAO|nr:LamG domain-containing protein [Allomuricauda algicola]TMU54616.1 LamG domain-containing protein [Allomuricauda algicola]